MAMIEKNETAKTRGALAVAVQSAHRGEAYIWAIITSPNSEQDTSVASSIMRAKS